MSSLERAGQPKPPTRYDPERAAEMLVASNFVPDTWKANGTARIGDIVYGCAVMASLDLDPLFLFRYGWAYKGQFHLLVEGGAVLAARAGYDLEVTEETPRAATVRIRYQGGPWRQARYTWEEAEKAELTKKDNYRAWPTAMMVARAQGKALRRYAPEVYAGIQRAGVWDDDGGQTPEHRPTIPEAYREPELDDDERLEIIAAITKLPPDQFDWFKRRWKDDLGCPNLQRGDWLTKAHGALARYMLADADRAIDFAARLAEAMADATPDDIHDDAPEAAAHGADDPPKYDPRDADGPTS